MSTLLNPANYFFNYYVLPFWISAPLIFFLGMFVYVQDRKSLNNFSYFIVCVAGGIWLLIDAITMSSKNEMVAFFWARLDYVGITLIPPSMYFFSSAYLGILQLRKKWIFLNYALAIGFILIFLFTDKFVVGVNEYYFGKFSKLGDWGIVYLTYFFGVSSAFFWDLTRGVKREHHLIKRTQIKRILFAFGIAFFGSLEFLPTYGFELYPIGFLPLFLFVIVVAHTIIHYKFLNIETVIHKTIMWLVASSMVFVPIVLFSYWFYPWYQHAHPLNVALLCGVIFVLLTLYLKAIQPRIDQVFQRRQYDLNDALNNFVESVTHLKGVDELVGHIEDLLMQLLYAEWVSVYLLNEQEKKYELVHGAQTGFLTAFAEDDALMKWFADNDIIVNRAFVEVDPQYKDIQEIAKTYFERFQASLVMPLILDGKVLGVVNVGRKVNLRNYRGYELQFLTRLKNSATIALSNSLLYGHVEEQVTQKTEQLLQTQDQLIRAEKLATIGTLAGGVAHEINNPLTAVLTNVQMLLNGQQNPDDKESLEMIEEATKRCRTIVQKLMTYSRRPLEEQKTAPIDLVEAISRVVSFLEYQLEQDNIIIGHKSEMEHCYTQGNQDEIEQVLTNLILNAKDAIKSAKNNGTITIMLAQDKKHVAISIRDDGKGIDAKHMTKIFDPFFTTKDVGEGTGLGLAICQAIIERHNGSIAVASDPGQGTIMTIVLPRLTKATQMGTDKKGPQMGTDVTTQMGADQH